MAIDYYEGMAAFLEDFEEQERVARNRRLRFALRAQDREAEALYNKEHQYGYCPHCFLLKHSKTCENCGE